MPSPKKKLPTGPIRINPPVTKPSESSTVQPQAPLTASVTESEPDQQMLELKKQDSGLDEVRILESSQQDSTITESCFCEGSILDSSSQLSEFPEATLEESEQSESTQMGVTFSTGINESSIPESGLTETEYKKVAMRLSSEAVDTLRQLRATTGVPYEILVDVMIRNWDKLPQRTRTAYLQQAKQVRGERLIAGQEKTMKTIRTKYLAQ